MKFSYIYIFFAALVLVSCTDDIELQLDDPAPVLAIDGKLSQDSLSTIRLSEIQNYFASEIPNFSTHKNAQIDLFEDSVQVATYTFNDAEQRFEVNYPVKSEHFYHIEFSLESGDRYVSIPEWVEEVTPIDTLWYEVEESGFGGDDEGRRISVKLNTYEPEGLGDNYQWKAYVNGEYLSEPFDLTFNNDQFVDGQYIFQAEIFDFSEKDYNEYKSKSPTGQVFVTIEQHRTTELYYNFLFQVFQQTAVAGNPFSAPPAEIQGNVHLAGNPLDRVLGYYTVSYYDSKTIEVILP